MSIHEAALDASPAYSDSVAAEASAPELKRTWEQVTLFLFVLVPFIAVLAAIPVMWGWGLSVRDLVIAGVMYVITAHGVTVGFHRHFTHKSFRTNKVISVLLAVAGSMAIQGPVVRWVADHRKHHRFSDKADDPHSPWRYGEGVGALARGFFHAHLGWLFDKEQTSQSDYAADLMADRAIRTVSGTFPIWVITSMLLPPLIGGLWAWSWQGAATAFFWGSLVRVAALHHVTFAINSVCHITGRRPFRTKDRSRNVWWLAIPSMGEAWHNFHHAEPRSARHGVRRFEIDTSAMFIWLLERLHLAHDVRWPSPACVARRRLDIA